MASARLSSGNQPPAFPRYLTPQQQSLLFAALSSNTVSGGGGGGDGAGGPPSASSALPHAVQGSPPSGTASDHHHHHLNNDVNQHHQDAFQDNPFLDGYDYDTSFDLDFSAIDGHGDMTSAEHRQDNSRSTSAETETHEKRSHPDDDEDEESSGGSGNGNAAKRHEGAERVAKKPGRKPLTEEPTSKRKAQNRAAQRAFRERKEKHLKDLETKVDELQKASEAANHENTVLRSKIEQMTTELGEYKKRLTSVASTRPGLRDNTNNSHLTAFGQAAFTNVADVNFQFEFPRFGLLPGQPSPSAAASSPSPMSQPQQQPQQPQQQKQQKQPQPQQQQQHGRERTTSAQSAGSSVAQGLDHFASNFGSPLNAANLAKNSSRASVDSGTYSRRGAATTSSPSASSNSMMGSSSCETSPEPFTQSPMGFKPIDALATIGEEQPSLTKGETYDDPFAGMNLDGSFDWLAQQNGGQFDPQLFGDYRESQESILAKGGLDDSFFNEAVDFYTPYYTPPALPAAAPKKNLIAEIDAERETDDEVRPMGQPVSKPMGQPYSCPKLWEKISKCEKIQSGEIDIDSLCSELQQKATCTGNGPEIAEADFRIIMKKYVGDCQQKNEGGGGVSAVSTVITASATTLTADGLAPSAVAGIPGATGK